MNTIYLLTDYLNKFGSKHNSEIYKNGMDKEILSKNFERYGYKTEFLPISKVDFRNQNWRDRVVLYSSQEDIGYFYKSYIEDIIYGLELAGAKVIPSYKFLKAHSNKVFMEILRDLLPADEIKNLRARYYGSAEEALQDIKDLNFPVVIKGAEGAMSTNVTLAQNEKEAEKKIKKLSATRNIKEEFREFIRGIKYSRYQKQSKYRHKFIIQDFLPNLTNDYKVLAFGNKFYIIERSVRANDFRASGGGINTFGSDVKIPKGIFETSRAILKKLNVPMLSLDFALHENSLYLIELQSLYFGTSGHWKSDCFYSFEEDKLVKNKNTLLLEEVYVESIIEHLNKK